MDAKTKKELIYIRSMAASVIEKVDALIPDAEKKKRRSKLSDTTRAKILNHRRLIRLRHAR